MKNELKMGIACGTILVAGFAAQIGMTQHESKQIAQQIQNQTHILTQQAQNGTTGNACQSCRSNANGCCN
jgi:hypothetical protein